jgi:hypothetical protein
MDGEGSLKVIRWSTPNETLKLLNIFFSGNIANILG